MTITLSELVKRNVKPGLDIARDLNGIEADLWHGATGVSGEAGELLDAVKKHVIYKRDLDLINMIEELGDLEFYLEQIRQNIGVTREEVIEANIIKLLTRYPVGYSNKAAQERADKSG